MKLRLAVALASLATASTVVASHARAAPLGPRVCVLDDGERISADPSHPLPQSPWPGEVSLFALGDETVAFQVVVDAWPPHGSEHVTAKLSPFCDDAGATLPARVTTFAEEFVDVTRATGNAKDPDDALHATREAAPPVSGPASFVGFMADPLIPGAVAEAPNHGRPAVWVDVDVPKGARAGTYHATLDVRSGEAPLLTQSVVLRVIGRDLPYPGAAITTFYEEDTLVKRMVGAAASGRDASDGARAHSLAAIETSLRQVLHAHRVSAIHEITSSQLSPIDDDALTGALYTEARGYHGPGQGEGEGILALGAYGAYGFPDATKVDSVRSVARHLRERGVFDRTATFVYAADENCASPVPEAWVRLLAVNADARGVRVGATCDKDPRQHPADLVIATPEGYDPELAREARARGKWTWAYNGRRPFGGPMMLDMPATELRANAWIAARYDIARWFYWESTFWLDRNKGGHGGQDGFDPFTVAETFHNRDGDWADGDGILVYPGTQRPAGMRDYGKDEVFPSVRLKNLRRGAEDAGYIALARAVDAKRTDAIVARMIPRALAGTKGRATWSDRGVTWLEARRELVEIFAPGVVPMDFVADAGDAATVPPPSPKKRGCAGCAVGARGSSAEASAAALFVALALAGRRRSRSARA